MGAADSSSQGDYGATSWRRRRVVGGPVDRWLLLDLPDATPPVPGGPRRRRLGYSSQSVDGRTAATNNQGPGSARASPTTPGYIERRYKACADDGHDDSNGDQCWAYDNATIVPRRRHVRRAGQGRHDRRVAAQPDDDSKVEHLTGATNGDDNGEYWKVTTTDGTQYYFGLNQLPGWRERQRGDQLHLDVPVYGDDSGEPCYNATFADSCCNQAWRWNLDYVVDPHGNAMSYCYGTGDQLLRAGPEDHRERQGLHPRRLPQAHRLRPARRTRSTPPSRPRQVVFTTAERCIGRPARTAPPRDSRTPRPPTGRTCPGTRTARPTRSAPGQNSPTFWTRKQLTKSPPRSAPATRPTRRSTSGASTHVFTDNGDGSKSLWLQHDRPHGQGRHRRVRCRRSSSCGTQLAQPRRHDRRQPPPLIPVPPAPA